MKNNIKISLALALTAPLFSSCLEEFTPTDSVTQEQVNRADKSSIVNAIPAYLNTFSSSYNYDIGFGGFNIWRDRSTGDMPIYVSAYDYFYNVGMCEYLNADSDVPELIFSRYYALIQKANLVFNSVDPEHTESDCDAAVTAYAYRANSYLELAQWFEYKRTGFAGLDSKAESAGIYGLTVPIVTEETTDTESRNNPRAPFWKLYRFVLTDLNKGEKYSAGIMEPSVKTMAGKGVIYGLKARFWLTIGSRFDIYPEDLAEAMSHEEDSDISLDRFGITSSRDCFRLAAEYARKAIGCGYSPLTENQWFDPTTGFNTVNSSWMWANVINTDNELAKSRVWSSWPAFMSPETTYGVSNTTYSAYNLIDRRLYETISDDDWRKTTWIDPSDVADQNAFSTKYARGTSLGYDEWSKFTAYAGFKFHPAQGNRDTSTVGNAVSLPLMRVEEMYLIEAEAIGRADGASAGRALLESFVNTYRYKNGGYRSRGEGIEGFIDDVFNQRRVEFWGEGIVMWDYRRLERPITRGYDGTNWVETYRFNSNPNAVAPWTTMSIPQHEATYNIAIILNPDPSSGVNYFPWTGN